VWLDWGGSDDDGEVMHEDCTLRPRWHATPSTVLLIDE
jgi:hypothetical protein